MSETVSLDTGLRLRVLEGKSDRETDRLERSTIALGRAVPDVNSNPAHLTFLEPTVSRLHALLHWNPDYECYEIHHRSQTNPSLVNGVAVYDPMKVSVGDRIELGRLVLQLELDPSAPVAPKLPLSKEAATIQVLRLLNGARHPVPVHGEDLLIHFGDRESLTPSENSIALKAQESSAVLAKFPVDGKSWTVSQPEGPPCTFILAQKSKVTLKVPLGEGTQETLSLSEAVLHQDFALWVDQTKAPVEVLPKELDTFPRLVFQNGPWLGAELLLPGKGHFGLNLGMKTWLFERSFPEKALPQVSITFHDGVCSLRLHLNPEGQAVMVDGRQLAVGEKARVPKESTLTLGDLELLWCDPTLKGRVHSYQIETPEGNFPFDKTSLTLGTAPHCQIRLSSAGLPPVLGTLTLDTDGVKYHHQDFSNPACLGDLELSAGFSAPLTERATIIFANGFSLSLKSLPSESSLA